MATLEQMAQKLRDANPENKPMGLQWMAEQWWPDASWLKVKSTLHNGGAKVGGRVAGGMAGRMERAGLLQLHDDGGARAYVLAPPKAKSACAAE